MRAKQSVGALKAVTSLVLVALSSFAGAQTAVLGSTSAGHTFVYPNVTWAAGACPANLTSQTVSGSAGEPQGVGFYGSDFALVASFSTSQIFNIQLSTASTLNTINSGAFGYSGTGTIAVAPSLNFALAQENNALKAISAPFTAPTATQLAMPGSVASYQTQAIVFNSASRAFIANSAGISVLDPPYTAVAFTMPVGASEAIAITPDGNTLMVTSLGGTVRFVTAPFSAASTAVTLAVPGSAALDGIYTTPDGSQALVVDASASQSVFAINAPYSASSTVQKITTPAGSGTFEDVSISADGLFALVTGNAGGSTDPLVGIRAPFTTAGATPCNFPVVGGRGAGSVRFLPTNLQPPPGPPARTHHRTDAELGGTGSASGHGCHCRTHGAAAPGIVAITGPAGAGNGPGSPGLFLVAILIAFAGAVTANAAPVEISLYSPATSGGPTARTLDNLVATFERSNRGIKVKTTYAGSYPNARAVALDAKKRTAMPTLAVLPAADLHTLLDRKAIVPFDTLARDYRGPGVAGRLSILR